MKPPATSSPTVRSMSATVPPEKTSPALPERQHVGEERLVREHRDGADHRVAPGADRLRGLDQPARREPAQGTYSPAR